MSVALATNIVDFVRRQLSFSTGICQVFRCLLAKACKDRERKTFGKTKVAVQRQKRGPQMQRPLKAPGTQCVMARIDKSSGSSKRMQENARDLLHLACKHAREWNCQLRVISVIYRDMSTQN